MTRLLSVDIAAHLPACALVDPNTFRKLQLYSAEVNFVLRWHEPSLRIVFGSMAEVSRTPRLGQGAKTPLLDLRGWLRLLAATQIIGVDVTERDAVLCFCWARMVVVNCTSAHDGSKLNPPRCPTLLCALQVSLHTGRADKADSAAMCDRADRADRADSAAMREAALCQQSVSCAIRAASHTLPPASLLACDLHA